MATWAALYPWLMPSVRGVSAPQADQELRTAAQEFCERTRAWLQWLDPIALTGAASYVLALPAGAMVHQLERATLGGVPVELPNWRGFDVDTADNQAQGRGFTTADRITVVPVATYAAGQVLKLQAVLKPSGSATTLPDAMAAQFGRFIAEGAKARLMLLAGREYSNPALAGVAQDAFEQAIGRIQHEAYKGFGGSVPRQRIRDC